MYVLVLGQGKVLRVEDKGQEGADQTARGAEDGAHQFAGR